MELPDGFEFVEQIDPKFAAVIQRLTLEDLRRSGFNNPIELVDPNSVHMVAAQEKNLREHPERYCGVMYKGQLIAFMKQNEWFISDERPFAVGLRAFWLLLHRALGQSTLSNRPWGIFGLVVSEDLGNDEYASVLSYLLERSFFDEEGWPRTVNIVIAQVHEKEWLPYFLGSHGFRRKGKPGEAAGARGVRQARYQRSAS